MPDVPADCPPQLALLMPGVKLTLVAEHPQVVTPVGIDCDPQGRVCVALSHTHFRPAGYPGPAHDEIVVLADPDAAGRAQTRSVFYEKTTATMGLALGPDGWVYLAERSMARDAIVKREELKSSVMPPGLLAPLTDREIRDLLAFLESPPAQ
jgi:hypothetical protein